MGSLMLPSSGILYIDTAPIIYTVERYSDYERILLPLWTAVEAGTVEVVTSELTMLEALVKPLRDSNYSLAQDYEKFLTATKFRMLPVTLKTLKNAAQLRATANLKTPDAIHAATGIDIGCVQFITNDKDYRRVPSLSVIVLKEII
ncbi:MAG: type II toxin-antitoxin system VapC family toxin [Pyrinomonadaceae bacterium]